MNEKKKKWEKNDQSCFLNLGPFFILNIANLKKTTTIFCYLMNAIGAYSSLENDFIYNVFFFKKLSYVLGFKIYSGIKFKTF